jgi:ribonuclease Z
MMPLPKRWLTALMTRYNGSSLLIDCGEGTQIAIKEKGWSFNPIDVICFTHYHADHVSGLPGLLLTIGNSDRTEPVTLIGPKGLQRVVAAARVMAPELPFEIRCIEIGGVQEHFSISGYEIEAFRVNHTVTCYGYSISIPRIGKFDAARAMELGIPQNMWNKLQHGENITINNETFYPNMVMGEARKGLKVTYTTDSRPTDSIVENAKGSDLFICEGMYGENDKECKAKENRHMTFEEAAKMAKSADVGQMWLTHFSPSLVRPKDYIDKAKKIFPQTELGSDGKTIELRFCD